jgi:nicotinamidase-related amidase
MSAAAAQTGPGEVEAGKTALLVIDLQNDYFQSGAFPLWEAEATAGRVGDAIRRARAAGVEVILIQHVARAAAPFFNAGTAGAEIHPEIRAAAPDAPVVVKHAADSFHETALEEILKARGVTRLLLCGMMTQNCVTHTAISKAAEGYDVAVIGDLSTTVSQILHRIALNGLSTRVAILDAATALG